MIGAMLDLRLFPAVDALFGYRSRVESDFCAEVWMPESIERTIEWHESPGGAGGRGVVKLIDQRLLPPAVGERAGSGFCHGVGGLQSQALRGVALLRDLEAHGKMLRESRPTAVNLFWAI